MKKIVISDEGFQILIEESIKRIKTWKYSNRFQDFMKDYPDNTFEFCFFFPKETGLDVEILLDESSNYYHDNHPLWMYFRNGNSINEELVPVVIHRYKPFILDENYKIKISKKSLNKIYDFIKEYYFPIVDYGDGVITYDEFKKILNQKKLNEVSLLTEMPRFNKGELGLPTAIWIDNKRSMQHGYRIKVRDTNNDDTNNWATITIDKFEPKELNIAKNTFLTNKQIDMIKDFVRINYETLVLAAQGKFNSKKDIKDSLIIYDQNNPFSQANKALIKIDFMSVGDNIYVIVKDGELQKKLIAGLSKIYPFKKYDDKTAFVDILNISGDGNQKIRFIKGMIDKVAANLNVDVKLINSTVLDDMADYYEKTKWEKLI